jgi:hypothetical protein
MSGRFWGPHPAINDDRGGRAVNYGAVKSAICLEQQEVKRGQLIKATFIMAAGEGMSFGAN